MTSIIKVNEIQDTGGNTILSSNGTGTFTSNLPSANNTPAFFAYNNVDQTVSDSVQTKVQFQTEEFDTNNAFDNTTNYRFTVPSGEGGKYYVTAGVYFESSGGIDRSILYLFKNGIRQTVTYFDLSSGDLRTSPVISVMLNLSAGDYLEVYATLDILSGSAGFIRSDISTYFGAYKILT